MGLDNGPDRGPESGFYKKERGRSERSRKDVQRHVQRVEEPKMGLDKGPDSGPESGFYRRRKGEGAKGCLRMSLKVCQEKKTTQDSMESFSNK